MDTTAKDDMMEALDSNYAVMVGEVARFGTWKKERVDSIVLKSEGTLAGGESYFVVDIVTSGTLHTRNFFSSPGSFSGTTLALLKS